MKLQTLWNIDPGHFRLKHAVKTIFAILITLWLVRNEAVPFKLLAGIVSGFSMQGVVAKAYSSRIIQIIVLDLAYFLAFSLGLLVHGSEIGSAVVLVIVGFFANYARRFGLQHSVAPMMGWSLCFFATILPFEHDAIWVQVYGLVVALIVAGFVNGLVFPENYPRLFVANSNRLFQVLGQGMHELRRYVLGVHSDDMPPSIVFEGLTTTLTRLLESNQAMDESEVFSSDSTRVNTILLQQYALVHTYVMIIDSYRILYQHNHQLSKPARIGLSLMYKQFEKMFASMNMLPDYTVTSMIGGVSLAKRLSYTPPTEPALIIVLLNLMLSFNLFNRHVSQLLRGDDAP